MIKYDKLFSRLSEEGKSATNWLRTQGMHPAVVNKLRKNERVNTDTIDRLCQLLDCQPGDILEYADEDVPIKISKTRQYRILQGMKQRCYNPNVNNYAYYGARGIGICDAWLGKEGAINFYNWSLTHGYDDKLTIDRVDAKKDYSPQNCIWIEKELNSPNKKLFIKLYSIIYNHPTFEMEYLLEHINSVQDEEKREFLMEALQKAEKTQRRKRLSDPEFVEEETDD